MSIKVEGAAAPDPSYYSPEKIKKGVEPTEWMSPECEKLQAWDIGRRADGRIDMMPPAPVDGSVLYRIKTQDGKRGYGSVTATAKNDFKRRIHGYHAKVHGLEESLKKEGPPKGRPVEVAIAQEMLSGNKVNMAIVHKFPPGTPEREVLAAESKLITYRRTSDPYNGFNERPRVEHPRTKEGRAAAVALSEGQSRMSDFYSQSKKQKTEEASSAAAASDFDPAFSTPPTLKRSKGSPFKPYRSAVKRKLVDEMPELERVPSASSSSSSSSLLAPYSSSMTSLLFTPVDRSPSSSPAPSESSSSSSCSTPSPEYGPARAPSISPGLLSLFPSRLNLSGSSSATPE